MNGTEQSMRQRLAPEGPERLCSRCKEWWPEDLEFFNRHARDKWQPWCKACTNEARAEARKKAKLEAQHAASG